MTRSVVFDISGVLEAFDYRGVLIHTQEIQAEQKIKLPFTQKNFFKFNDRFFGVCEGVGNLDYRDYPKNLNFNALLTESIENYLLEFKEPENKQQKESKILGWEIDEDLFCAEFRATLQKCEENEHDK
ncbi:hypothetical protein [Helicobacter pylori]|uniref:hypothetical protein n=1 Tax=Helicobacter pylori TaxID=210 RepID=UPI001F0C3519|nr:hypothetical protein [Helicobacter pylori]